MGALEQEEVRGSDEFSFGARRIWAWEKDWEEAGGGNEVTQEEQTSG